MVMQPALVLNPFGTLPAMPQMSIGNGGSSPSVQYGISSLPVSFTIFEYFQLFLQSAWAVEVARWVSLAICGTKDI